MPDGFPVGTPDVAWTRRVLCAAEIVDAVTLEPVLTDIIVQAQGLSRPPQLNASGQYVWLEEGTAKPLKILVDASQTNYADAQSPPPAPPQKGVRIELAPRFAYAFPQGASALRGTLFLSRLGTPKPVSGAAVWLQWSGDTGWVDAPIKVTSNDNGDFAAPLRFSPKDRPSVTSGELNVRLRVTRSGVTRTSDPFAMRRGDVTPASSPFNWDDLHP
jgi:hypothetical protein